MRAGVFLGSFYGAKLPRITNTGSPVSEKNSSRQYSESEPRLSIGGFFEIRLTRRGDSNDPPLFGRVRILLAPKIFLPKIFLPGAQRILLSVAQARMRREDCPRPSVPRTTTATSARLWLRSLRLRCLPLPPARLL